LVLASKCPDPELVKPCDCYNDNGIHCGGNQYINLKETFHRLSQKLDKDNKSFEELTIYNTAITELEDNTFSDITFGEILFLGASKLSTIHSNVFNGTNLKTTSILTESTPLDESIFKSLSQFKNLESLTIFNSNIEQIPSYAFPPENKLKRLNINGPKLKKISDFAFYNLDSLTQLIISGTLDGISLNALNFRKESKESLEVQLDNNLWNASSIAVNALNNFKRPVVLKHRCKWNERQISYLNENVFGPFLNANEGNEIRGFFNYFNPILCPIVLDCNDCRNNWLKNSQKYSGRIHDLRCTDGKPITDHFQNC